MQENSELVRVRSAGLTRDPLSTIVSRVSKSLSKPTSLAPHGAQAMAIQKCQLCNMYLYPGDKRFCLKICIFPDPEDDSLGAGFCPEDELDGGPLGEVLEDDLWLEECEDERECCQQASLILCKNCQDQFLQNPVVRDNLLFPERETLTKTVH